MSGASVMWDISTELSLKDTIKALIEKKDGEILNVIPLEWRKGNGRYEVSKAIILVNFK